MRLTPPRKERRHLAKGPHLAILLFLGITSTLSLSAQDNPVPFVNQPLVPTAVAPGGPDFTLTVNGTGFDSGATVNWNGTPLATTFVSSSQLTAAIPATDVATIGSASVTVVNPAPGGGVSNAALFLITFPIPSVTFKQTDCGTNVNAVAVTAADFNGDGKADVAVLRDSEVLIFLGNGDGTFRAHQSYSTGGYSGSVFLGGLIAADLNRDGRMDLAVTNHYSSSNPNFGSISVLLGNGNGTFQPATDFPVPNFAPSEIVSGDFNGDGALDLAAVGRGANVGIVGIFLGSGDGAFIPGNEYPIVTGYPSSAAVGDFNGDGALDVAVPSNYGDVSILFGNGDGTFHLGADVMPGGGISIAAADFDRDARLDLAVGYNFSTSVGHARVAIILGSGPRSDYNAGDNVGGPSSLDAADVNGDGKLDLLISEGGPVLALFGGGDGSFGSLLPAASGASLVTADFDNDGRVDLATGNYFSPALSVFIQSSPVDLEPGGLHFGDQLVGTPSNTLTATLTNNLTGPLTISNIVLGGANSADFTETNDCPLSPSTLGAGASCTITATFFHTTLGDKSAAVTVSDDASGYPQQVLNLTGAVINPTASLSSTILNFGGQPIDVTSAPQTVTLSNSGSGALTISGITVTGDFAETNNCGSRLAQGATCQINLTFTPTNPGTRFGMVTITDNAFSSEQTISLTGMGVAPTVTLSATSLTFGDQKVHTTSASQTVILTNNGPGPLTVGSVTQTNDFGVFSNCVATVAASATCTISVTFTPEVNGTVSGTATINDNAAVSPQTVSLTGKGLGPESSISPSSLSFPDQPTGTTSPPQVVTLTNSGSATMTLTGIFATSPFAETTSCLPTLNAGASCSISVAFTSVFAGITYGSLTINNDAPGSPQIVSLVGTTALNFPDQPVGQTSAPLVVTLANSGSLRLISGISTTGDFAASGACGALGSGQSCAVNVTFRPTAPGARTGTLMVADDAPGSPHVVALSGTGLGPGVSFSTAALDFGSVLMGTTGAPQTVTLSNSGNRELSITGISLVGTNSGDYALANGCGTSLAATANCTLSVTFAPAGTSARSATLTITDNAFGSPHGVTLAGTGTDFTLGTQTGGSTSATVTAGGTATFNLQLAPTGFSGTVALACAFQGSTPRGASCSVSPSSVTVNGVDPAPFAVNVATTARATAAPQGPALPPLSKPWARHGVPLLLGLMMLVLTLKSRRVRGRLCATKAHVLLAATLLAVVLWSACGGESGGTTPPTTGTPAGTYNLTLTATAGGVSKTSTLTLKVN